MSNRQAGNDVQSVWHGTLDPNLVTDHLPDFRRTSAPPDVPLGQCSQVGDIGAANSQFLPDVTEEIFPRRIARTDGDPCAHENSGRLLGKRLRVLLQKEISRS